MIPVHAGVERNISDAVCLKKKRQELKYLRMQIAECRMQNYSERLNKVVIARSEATCLRAEALRRASVAIS